MSDLVSTHESLAPTFLALAKGEDKLPAWVDGGVIPITPALQHHPLQASTETFSVEFWSDSVAWENSEELFAPGANTYKTLRIIGPTYDCKYISSHVQHERKALMRHIDSYAVWCTGEHELFDIKVIKYDNSVEHLHILMDIPLNFTFL